MSLAKRACWGLILGAAWLVPGGAAAAPMVVTYEITGGTFLERGSDVYPIVSGSVVVTLPNPGSGVPPFSTTGHRIDLRFQLTPAWLQVRALTPSQFVRGVAYRGAAQTLTATGTWRFPPREGAHFFRLSAGSTGNILFGRLVEQSTPEATASFWTFTGREVSVVIPEPASAALVALGLGLLAGVTASPRLLRRRD